MLCATARTWTPLVLVPEIKEKLRKLQGVGSTRRYFKVRIVVMIVEFRSNSQSMPSITSRKIDLIGTMVAAAACKRYELQNTRWYQEIRTVVMSMPSVVYTKAIDMTTERIS